MAVVASLSPCATSWIFSPGPCRRGGSTAAGVADVAGGADVGGAADVAGGLVVAAGVVLGLGGLPFTCRCSTHWTVPPLCCSLD